ncbi:hypothetical protein XNC1_3614 [Xenorhabdus nematophila ATCC 19061]|uniref:Uncharacterized protein n=1 Tax=Xenorhabdus nematophila (strain ATCC 19061 / DSM 3370 / CCUG 14189 / LMG 1036 / NCIMB 9965 / AN6) TaxID=406817 RepID=D3VA81_XENNA|nr:hypothetical protein XNC1_3614 [Xenorhabdus nematophila ATCC 19061]
MINEPSMVLGSIYNYFPSYREGQISSGVSSRAVAIRRSPFGQ